MKSLRPSGTILEWEMWLSSLAPLEAYLLLQYLLALCLVPQKVPFNSMDIWTEFQLMDPWAGLMPDSIIYNSILFLAFPQFGEGEKAGKSLLKCLKFSEIWVQMVLRRVQNIMIKYLTYKSCYAWFSWYVRHYMKNDVALVYKEKVISNGT